MKSHLIRRLVLIFGALLLVGCHKLEATTKVESDGSGELRMGVGFSAEERANMEKQFSNPQDFCNTSQTSTEITVVEERRGDETWCITIMQFKNLEELRGLYEQGSGIKINRLEIIDGKFYYDLDMDTLSPDSDFEVFTEITWTVILPGAPGAHNADQSEAGTLIWLVDPESEDINLRAESELPKAGSGFSPCGAAALVLVAVLFPLLQPRRRPTERDDDLRP